MFEKKRLLFNRSPIIAEKSCPPAVSAPFFHNVDILVDYLYFRLSATAMFEKKRLLFNRSPIIAEKSCPPAVSAPFFHNVDILVDYLYFRLSATASSSQRLLYSFSAWFPHGIRPDRQSPSGPRFYAVKYLYAASAASRLTAQRPRIRSSVLPALRHRQLVAAVVILILRVVSPWNGSSMGAPFFHKTGQAKPVRSKILRGKILVRRFRGEPPDGAKATHQIICTSGSPPPPHKTGQAKPVRSKILRGKILVRRFRGEPPDGAKATHQIICTSGSPPPPTRHSGCYTHFPRGL